MHRKGYLFWDDETANPQQHICQVSYCLTDFEGNQLGEPVTSYINPASEFSRFNIRIHGIRPEDVVDAPTFDVFWKTQRLNELLSDFVFVAHNAKGADLHHIKKSLAAYDMTMPKIEFIDTMQLALARKLPGGLKELCESLNIPLDIHHDATEDAIACRNIFWKLNATDLESEEYAPSNGKTHGKTRQFSGLGLIHNSDKTIETALEEFEANNLRGNPLEINSLIDLRVVVTGVVPGYNRKEIEDALKNAGAVVAKTVSNKTQYVAIGDNAGQTKLDAATKLEKPVITVGELLDIMNR